MATQTATSSRCLAPLPLGRERLDYEAREVISMPFLLCADFGIFPDDYVLGPSFTLAAMDFTDVPGGATSFVNETAGTKALQFPEVGLEVDLPPLAIPSRIRIRVGAFAGPFDINALDAAGSVVATRHIALLNVFHTVGIAAKDIDRLEFRGGNNEGMIAFICVVV
jgi:hypothetical protein